jgi:hypothetical protein
LNLPARWQGRTLGTLNLLHQTGWYDATDLPAGRLLEQTQFRGTHLN